MASFLGCTQYNSYQLPFVEANDQWRLLRSLIGSFQHFKEKTSPFGEEENALPSRQYTSSHVPGTMAKFNEFRYELLPYPAYSPDLTSCDFPVSKPEEMVRKKEIHHQRVAHRRNKFILKGWTNHIIRTT